MKFILALIIAGFSILSASAQDSKKVQISGNVITQDGKAAEFVTVAVKGTSAGTTADEKGHFRLYTQPGKQTLVVVTLSLDRAEFPITVKADGENHFPDIRIAGNAIQMDPIVVTGQFSPQSMRNSLYKVRSINSQHIQQKAPIDVQSLLNTEIGIRLSNDMALGETSFELMGMSGNNVKVLVDGIPMLDRGSSKQSLSQIDVNRIERVEIVEGPMSVVYGTDALAGVINIITKKGAGLHSSSTWNVNARLHEESRGPEYGFFHDKGIHNQSLDLGVNLRNGLYVNAGYTHNANGGWVGDKTGREKRWHPINQHLATGTLGYRRNNLNIWYRLDYVDETIKGPLNSTPAEPTQYCDKDFLTDRFNHLLQADWNLRNKLMLNVSLSNQSYKRRTHTAWTDTSTGDRWLSSTPGSQDVTSYSSWLARATATWNISQKISLQPGLEYHWTQGSGGRIGGTPSIGDLAFFLSAEYKPWHWLSLRPGVRTFLQADYKTPAAVPSLLTKFVLNDKMDIRLSYAYGFRTPTIQELYFSFHNENHDIDGNPDLKAEYSHNVTGSFSYRIIQNREMRLSAGISGFYNTFKDKIGLAPNLAKPNFYTYYNISDYKTAGASLESKFAWKGLNASLNVSVIGRYNNYSEEQTGQPAFRYSPEVSTNLSYRISRWGTELSLYYKFTGERKEYYYAERIGANGTMEAEFYLGGTPAYHYADLTLTQKLTPFLILNAGGKNLFNLKSLKTIAETQLEEPYDFYVGCGASWFIGLNLSLDGKFRKGK